MAFNIAPAIQGLFDGLIIYLEQLIEQHSMCLSVYLHKFEKKTWQVYLEQQTTILSETLKRVLRDLGLMTAYLKDVDAFIDNYKTEMSQLMDHLQLSSTTEIEISSFEETWKRSRKAERVDKPEVAKKRSPVF